ncbi:MAG: KH domain-containing protein [Oscillospiraceae bacterium]|nr:KH domain-containing protein [Oscillospiraceae bacterium]
MEKLLTAIVEPLIENVEQFTIQVRKNETTGYTVYHIRVAKSDMGRVIGKNGRIAKVIRTIIRSAAARKGEKAVVEIDECE